MLHCSISEDDYVLFFRKSGRQPKVVGFFFILGRKIFLPAKGLTDIKIYATN